MPVTRETRQEVEIPPGMDAHILVQQPASPQQRVRVLRADAGASTVPPSLLARADELIE